MPTTQEVLMTFNEDLIKDLRCPRCRGVLTQEEASDPAGDHEGGFICPACEVLYPVTDGIANFLVKDDKQQPNTTK